MSLQLMMKSLKNRHCLDFNAHLLFGSWHQSDRLVHGGRMMATKAGTPEMSTDPLPEEASPVPNFDAEACLLP